MKKFLFFGIIAIISFGLFAQNASLAYKYKIQYNSNSCNDSIKILSGKNYYNDRMQLIKEVVYGPEINDSSVLIWKFDIHGNLLKCSSFDSGKITDLLKIKYEYDKKGKIKKETFIRYDPFFEIYISESNKDSTRIRHYKNKINAKRQVYDLKTVEMYNSTGKKVYSYDVNKKNDTIRSNVYVYIPSEDTTKIIMPNDQIVIPSAKSHNIDIIGLNSQNEEIFVLYYLEDKYLECTIKKYDAKKNILMEQEYSAIKKRFTNEIKYYYNESNILIRKEDNDIDELIKIIYTFNNGKIVREDYLYDNILDHSFVFEFKNYSVLK